MNFEEYVAWIASKGISIERSQAEIMFKERESSIEGEKSRGIEASNKKGQENATLRKRLEGLDSLGYDPEKESVAEFFKRTIAEKDTTLKNSGSEKDELLRQIADINKKLDSEIQVRSAAEIQRDNTLISTKLREALVGKIYNAEDTIYRLIQEKRLKVENGHVVPADGKSFDDFVKNVFDEKKDFVITTQNPGSGGGAPAGGGDKSTPWTDDITVEAAMEKMGDISAHIAAANK